MTPAASGLDAQRVLVTGGAGVIGRSLVGSLVDRGAAVLCADLAERPDWMPAGVEYRAGDANDLDTGEVADFGPSYCFHLAATFERTAESPEFWEDSYRHNVSLSHHIASALERVPTLQRYVFASSYLVYDPALYLFNMPQGRPVSLASCPLTRVSG